MRGAINTSVALTEADCKAVLYNVILGSRSAAFSAQVPSAGTNDYTDNSAVDSKPR